MLLRWLGEAPFCGRLLTTLLVCAGLAFPGPLEFGLNELNAAFAERKLKYRVKTELSLDPPETYRIEPYASGGAYISGGDLRGLMYGLLEAAEQVRATGRVAKARGSAATPLRGIRISAPESAGEDYWRAYFKDLARYRFNRAHVDLPRMESPFEQPCLLSRVAADYAVDLTLGIGGAPAEDVAQLLAACPLVHSIAADSVAVIEATRRAGRLVSVDLDGAASSPAYSIDEAPVVRPRASWPPSFEIIPPGPPMDHPVYFWIWGRLAYDPKTKPPKGADASAYEAAREAALWIAAMHSSGSEYLARESEAGVPSAKLTAPAIVARLRQAAAKLDDAALPDLRVLAAQARELAGAHPHAQQPERPQITHAAPGSTPANQPLTLRVNIAGMPKQTYTVRLHYRFLDPLATETVIEAAAASDTGFTIPASEITGAWDMQFYFEVLTSEGSGWLHPDPRTAQPLPVVRVIPSRTGPN